MAYGGCYPIYSLKMSMFRSVTLPGRLNLETKQKGSQPSLKFFNLISGSTFDYLSTTPIQESGVENSG